MNNKFALRGFPQSHFRNVQNQRPKKCTTPHLRRGYDQNYLLVLFVGGLCNKNPRQALADEGSLKGGNNTAYRVPVLWHLGSSFTYGQMPCHSSAAVATQAVPKRIPWTY